MNVRLTPHAHPSMTVLYSGVARVISTGEELRLLYPDRDGFLVWTPFHLTEVAEIALDDEGGIE